MERTAILFPIPRLSWSLAALVCAVVSLAVATEALSQAESSPRNHGKAPPGTANSEFLALDEIVVTASRHGEEGFEAPRAVTVVNRHLIEEQAPQTVPDLLRGQVGVSVQQTTPGQAAPIIRGLIGSSVLTLVDGMRLNTAFFRPAPNQYFALLDPYNVERIEVVRGVASTLYGSDAMGGVVHVVTPSPRFDGDSLQTSAQALGNFTSANTGATTRLSLAAGRSGLAAGIGATYQTYNDLRAGDGDVQEPSGYDVWSADGKFVAEGDRQDAVLSVQYLRQEKTPRYDELVPGYGQTLPSSSTFYFEPNDRLFLHARYRLFEPVRGVDEIDANFAFQEINDDRRTRAHDSHSEKRERNRSRLLGATLRGLSRVAAWGVPAWLTLTYGADLYLDRIDSSRSSEDIDTGEVRTDKGRFADGSNLDTFGLYTQAEFELHPKLMLRLGGRFSLIDTHIPAADRGVGIHDTEDDLSGEAALVYRLRPDLHVVGSVGKGFRAANVFDLATLGDRPGNRFNVPNPGLKPEEVIGTDLGVRWSTRAARAEVFGFYSYYDDKIEEELTGEKTPAGRDIVTNANTNRVMLWGIEAGGGYSLGDRLELFATLTWTEGNEKFAGGETEQADRIPPVNGRLTLQYRPWPEFLLEPFVNWAAGQEDLSPRDRRDPRIDPDGTPGWITANLRSQWDFSPSLQLTAALENILDDHYREHGSGIDAPGVNATVALRVRL